MANAVSFSATNASLPSSTPVLNLTLWHGSTQLPLYHAAPLGNANANISITGPAILATTSTTSINSSQIAFISCDDADYPGNLKASNVFNVASNNNAAAIVFYSVTGQSCSASGSVGTNIQNVFSTTNLNEAASLVGNIKNMQMPFYARVGVDNSTTNSDNSSNNTMWYAPPGTALAMIILYAITGLITALFILIIITGAVRAHRHPERYGRRVVGGRTRQTRVGGLARAMLETLPIVKFGDRTDDKDIELAASASHSVENPPSVEGTEKPTDGIAPAAGAAAAASSSADLPGCSICTEDFEIGQDQRVLPCEHRFHPACIDPWLLNVSGTCPLCRVDLRPPEEEEQEQEQEDPVPEPVTPASRRRSVLMAITNLRRPDAMTREERLSALRRYRNENAASTGAGATAHTADEQAASNEAPVSDERSGRAAQLRRLFNVRTWRTTARRSAAPTAASSVQIGV